MQKPSKFPTYNSGTDGNVFEWMKDLCIREKGKKNTITENNIISKKKEKRRRERFHTFMRKYIVKITIT